MFRLLVQELKFRRNAILGWGLGLCFFPLVYVGIYPSVAEEMAGLADLEIYAGHGDEHWVHLGIGSDRSWLCYCLWLHLFMPLAMEQALWLVKKRMAGWKCW